MTKGTDKRTKLDVSFLAALFISGDPDLWLLAVGNSIDGALSGEADRKEQRDRQNYLTKLHGKAVVRLKSTLTANASNKRT